MRRCALRAIVRLRGTKYIVDCIFLPQTALVLSLAYSGVIDDSAPSGLLVAKSKTFVAAGWGHPPASLDWRDTMPQLCSTVHIVAKDKESATLR